MNWKERFGIYLVDISKYVLTGVVIASLFEDLQDSKLVIYVLSSTMAVLLLVIGLILSNKEEKTKKK